MHLPDDPHFHRAERRKRAHTFTMGAPQKAAASTLAAHHPAKRKIHFVGVGIMCSFDESNKCWQNVDS